MRILEVYFISTTIYSTYKITVSMSNSFQYYSMLESQKYYNVIVRLNYFIVSSYIQLDSLCNLNITYFLNKDFINDLELLLHK